MCGAAASSDAPRCEHCGARLATVACPSCFGMMFVGAKFCSHCGAQAARTELAEDAHESCPRCKVEMESVLIGKTKLEECPRCEGIWADAESLRRICADTEQQAAVLGLPMSQQAGETDVAAPVHYIPCPICHDLMNRVNFAHCSNVIINVCGRHGTWFDKEQLRRIVEFIRAGGLEKSRARELEELKEAEQRARAAAPIGAWTAPVEPMPDTSVHWHNAALSALASVVTSLLDR